MDAKIPPPPPGWTPKGLSKKSKTLDERVAFIKFRSLQYPYIVDVDHPSDGGPFPEPISQRIDYGKQFAFVPFLEHGKAVWLWENLDKARKFAKEFSGIKRGFT